MQWMVKLYADNIFGFHWGSAILLWILVEWDTCFMIHFPGYHWHKSMTCAWICNQERNIVFSWHKQDTKYWSVCQELSAKPTLIWYMIHWGRFTMIIAWPLPEAEKTRFIDAREIRLMISLGIETTVTWWSCSVTKILDSVIHYLVIVFTIW